MGLFFGSITFLFFDPLKSVIGFAFSKNKIDSKLEIVVTGLGRFNKSHKNIGSAVYLERTKLHDNTQTQIRGISVDQ